MAEITVSQFRNNQSHYIAEARQAPIELTVRGRGRQAAVVSPEFFDRAIEALEDQIDAREAVAARNEAGRISHEELLRELVL